MQRIFALTIFSLFAFTMTMQAQANLKTQVRTVVKGFLEAAAEGDIEKVEAYSSIEFQDGDDLFLRKQQKGFEIIVSSLGQFEIQDLYQFEIQDLMSRFKYEGKAQGEVFIVAFKMDKHALAKLGYASDASVHVGPMVKNVIGPLPSDKIKMPDKKVLPIIFFKMNEIALKVQEQGQNLFLMPIVQTKEGPKALVGFGSWNIK